jgi:hypothetical protein
LTGIPSATSFSGYCTQGQGFALSQAVNIKGATKSARMPYSHNKFAKNGCASNFAAKERKN